MSWSCRFLMRPTSSRPNSILQPTLRGSQYNAEAPAAASGPSKLPSRNAQGRQGDYSSDPLKTKSRLEAGGTKARKGSRSELRLRESGGKPPHSKKKPAGSRRYEMALRHER